MSLEYSVISRSITKNLEKTTKKNNGIYFTPPKTILKNIDFLNPYLQNIKNVLEPSCGSCEYITKLDNLYNLDFTCIEKNEEIYNQIKTYEKDNIKILNSDFINYDIENKFDLIIGNPPYFVIQKNIVPNEYYKYFEGRPNIFIIFIIKSLKMLKENGILSFVLPNSFINSSYYNKARKYIYTNYKILNIIDCKDDNYIETKQETIIFIIQNKLQENKENDKFSLNMNDNIIFGCEDNIKKIHELYANSTTLKNLGFNIKVGNVVWNQVKDILTDDNSKTRLIYSSDIENNKLVMKKYKNNEKKNYINKKGYNEPLFVINRGYGTGKYNFSYTIIDYENLEYLVENHLLIVYYNEDISKELLLDKYNKIKTSFENVKTKQFIDLYFGNNSINTNEILNVLPIYDI